MQPLDVKWEIFQPYFIGEFRRPCPTFCNLKEIFFSDGRRNSPGGKGPNMRLWHNSHCTGVFSRQVRIGIGIAACILGRRGGPACPPSPLPGTEPRSGNPQLLGNLAQRPAAARQQPHRLSLEFIRELTTRCTHQTPSCCPRGCTVERIAGN